MRLASSIFLLLFSSIGFCGEICDERLCFKDEHKHDFILESLDNTYGILSGEARIYIDKLISEKESEKVPFGSITLKYIMRNVFFVSMQKPHYYGSEVLIIKNRDGWSILNESDVIY